MKSLLPTCRPPTPARIRPYPPHPAHLPHPAPPPPHSPASAPTSHPLGVDPRCVRGGLLWQEFAKEILSNKKMYPSPMPSPTRRFRVCSQCFGYHPSTRSPSLFLSPPLSSRTCISNNQPTPPHPTPLTHAWTLSPRRESSSSSSAASFSSSSSSSLSHGSTFAASSASASRLARSARNALVGAPRGLSEYGRVSFSFCLPQPGPRGEGRREQQRRQVYLRRERLLVQVFGGQICASYPCVREPERGNDPVNLYVLPSRGEKAPTLGCAIFRFCSLVPFRSLSPSSFDPCMYL